LNLSSDPDQDYFTDGITDDLTTDLSRISGSFVIARNTAFTYKGKSVDVRQIGRELGVRYVLEGSVRRTGDQVRVNVQLIDSETGAHLWADRFDTDIANLGQAQDEITGRLAGTLNIELGKDVGRRIDHERAADSGARDLVMRGNALRLRPFSVASRQEALRAFERALQIDPESTDAKIGVAGLLVANLQDGWSSNVQDEARAEQLLLEALERDGNSARAHERIGVLRLRQNRLAEAKIELETAIALDRNHRSAFFQLGATLNALGQPEAAIPHIEKAIRLSPHDVSIPVSYMVSGRSQLLLGHVDEAIDLLRRRVLPIRGSISSSLD
jgi:adenylate cyclase